MDGSFRGYVADLVDLLHPSLKGAHNSGDGHLDRLAGVDLFLIGVAEVKGQLQLLIVHQSSHWGGLTHLVVDMELLDLLKLPGEGGPHRQVGGLFLQVGHILQQIIQFLLGVRHSILGCLTVNGVQGIAGHDSLAASDKDLLHRTALGQGNGSRFLGLGRT